MRDLRFLLVVGIDYNSSALFTVPLENLNDKIDLAHTSRRYPKALIEFLQKKKH
jgi:hypothetical protein